MNKSTRMDRHEVLRQVIDYYQASRDFNGLPLRDLLASTSELTKMLRRLTKEGQVSLVFGDRHPNPHILALDPESVEEQICKLTSSDLGQVCVYPTSSALVGHVDESRYVGMPYALRLARGEPQLRACFFDLVVLEPYRNDPRYHFAVDDIHGSISVKSSDGASCTMRETDQVFLQTFGFGYDEAMNRAVAVYLRYLSNLSPEHQQIWQSKSLPGGYKVHPDYYRASMLGDWDVGLSVFTAVLAEIHHIREMSKIMGRSPLFRDDYLGENRPRDFGFLIRPTLREFNSFVLTLDKILSENIDASFFKNDIALEEESERKDGKVVVRTKGSIQLLDEWVHTHFRVKDTVRLDRMIAGLKKIRKLRQAPAHSIEDDVFEQKYSREQRDLIAETYVVVKDLRFLLKLDPRLSSYQVPDRLTNIWFC